MAVTDEGIKLKNEEMAQTIILDVAGEINQKNHRSSSADARVRHEQQVTFLKDILNYIYEGGRTLIDDSALFFKIKLDNFQDTYYYTKARKYFMDELWKKVDHMGMVVATGDDIHSLVQHIEGGDTEKPKRKKKKRAKKQQPQPEEQKEEAKVPEPKPEQKAESKP